MLVLVLLAGVCVPCELHVRACTQRVRVLVLMCASELVFVRAFVFVRMLVLVLRVLVLCRAQLLEFDLEQQPRPYARLVQLGQLRQA